LANRLSHAIVDSWPSDRRLPRVISHAERADWVRVFLRRRVRRYDHQIEVVVLFQNSAYHHHEHLQRRVHRSVPRRHEDRSVAWPRFSRFSCPGAWSRWLLSSRRRSPVHVATWGRGRFY